MFEALANGVACQQISLQAGLTVLNRFVAAFGQAPRLSPEGQRAFPKPEALAGIDEQALRAVGFSLTKSRAIREIASAAVRGELEYEALAGLDDAAARARLEELRGVGRWTAEYVLLRGCGRLNILPGDDVGARNNLQKWLRRERPLDYERTKKLLRRWQPYAGLVYLHLLLKHLEDGTIMTATGTCSGAVHRARDVRSVPGSPLAQAAGASVAAGKAARTGRTHHSTRHLPVTAQECTACRRVARAADREWPL